MDDNELLAPEESSIEPRPSEVESTPIETD